MGLRLRKWIQGIHDTTFQLNADDVVVFVVGPSGRGKSLFVEEVTKAGLVQIGEGLRPCTAKVQAIRCELSNGARVALGVTTQKSIVFVDTPSFHTGENDGAEKEMSSWLNKSKSMSTLVGIIYMHRVESDPSSEPVQKHLNTFASTFPQDFTLVPQRLHAVFSYEGTVREDKIGQRRAAFRAQLDALHPSLTHGNYLKWNTSLHPTLFQRNDSETAWQAVVALFTPTRT